MISETWLDSKTPDALLLADPGSAKIYPYNLYRKDRIQRSGGGVAIFVHDKFNSNRVELPTRYVSDEIEILAVDIHNKMGSQRFICVYRPPSGSKDNAINIAACITELCNSTMPVNIAGDFNLHDIDWATLECSRINNTDEILLDCFLMNNLTQLVLEPTRVVNAENVLDLFLTTHTSVVMSISVEKVFHITDHESIIASIALPGASETNPDAWKYDFEHGDYEEFENFLFKVDWPSLWASSKDAETHYEIFLSVLKIGIEVYIPKRKISNKPESKPKHIRKLKAKKKKLYKTDKNSEEYKLLCREYDNALKEYYEKRESKCIQSEDVRKFYKFVNSKLKNTKNIGPIKKSDGTLALENFEKATLLNDFFASVFTVDNGIIPDFENIAPRGIYLSNVNFTPEKIFEKLKTLPNKKSRTPDMIPCLLYKKLALSLCEPLATIFNVSFQTGTIPSWWLTADVTPIHKKGLKSLTSNYRPVSQTCIAAKIMESTIKTELVNYLLKNKLFTRHQHGFLSNRSVSTQLLECLNEYTEAAMCKEPIDICYTDYSKAFDSVVISKLIVKLKGYGITGPLLKWLKVFLSNRKQRVVVNNTFSNYADVTSGVPQGACISGILFLVFVNDVFRVIKNVNFKMYADDLKFFIRVCFDILEPSPLQEDLNNLAIWSNDWQLKLAIEKCFIMCLLKGLNPMREYFINDIKLECVDNFKDLGVIISDDLSFSKHCSVIANKGLKVCGLIFRALTTKNVKLLIKAYKTYVRPILETSSVVWSPHYLKDIACIERVQRKFTRYLFKRCFNNHPNYKTRCQKLELQSLESRRKLYDLIMCYKIIHEKIELRKEEFFKLATYNKTRSNSSLKIYKPDARIDARKFFFSNRIIDMWNNLPNEVVNAKSEKIFKIMINFNEHIFPFCRSFDF